MRRGQVWLVDLDPVLGSESDKHRPAVIVSNDAANSTAASLGRGVVTVVPVTTNLRRVYPFQVLLPAGDHRTPQRLQGARRAGPLRRIPTADHARR
jgi:mRNA interferase MazF